MSAPGYDAHRPMAVGGGDEQKQEVMPSSNRGSGSPRNVTPMNHLLLASACLGSSADLMFLFDREDKQERPMMMPTQVFVDKLPGYSPGSSRRTPRTVPRASDDLEAGVDHPPTFPAAAPDTAEGGADHPVALPAAALDNAEAGVDQPAALPPAAAADTTEAGAEQPAALPAAAPDTAEAGAYQPCALQAVALDDHDTEDGISEVPALPIAAPDFIEDPGILRALPAAGRLLKGVTAEGDTALHVVATHGDSAEYIECANLLLAMDQDLLYVVNKRGDTSLHSASRAGKSRMISHLIKLAGNGNRLHDLLRMENGLKETALHDAVRIGSKDIVETLMKADRDLALYPLAGTSPLYLAILLGKNDIALTLHRESKKNLSYSGPNGLNALHAATFQGTGITGVMLNWNYGLTVQGDRDGSTPLLVASSLFHWSRFKQLFEANPETVYQADNNGLFPIHVAASIDALIVIRMILARFPSCASLRTAQGRTFLHVAAERNCYRIVFFVCRAPSLSWILNMQDNEGNTALHLAVRAGSLRIFGALYANKEVHLSLANTNDETPLDISRSMLPRGKYYNWNSNNQICQSLRMAGAKHSNLRRDQTEGEYRRQLKLDEMIKIEEKLKDASQLLGIGAVLIVTVAFGATFAVPGGFIADDHTNRGTPTLAGRYTFDAFMMANALAFICSSIATIGLMFSGTSLVSLGSRQIYFSVSVFFMSSSLTCLSAAFALGVYMVLAPVTHATGIAICVLTPLIVLYRSIEFFLKLCILARPLYLRLGPSRGLNWLARRIILRLFMELWPFIFIFGWAAIARKLRNHG